MKVFVEEQRFKNWILASVMTIPIVGGVIPLILAENEIPSFNSQGFWGIAITISAMVLVLLLMLSIKLKTKINEQGVYYQYFPNHFSERFISWLEIENCKIIKHNSFRKFRGYGFRKCYFGQKKGITMNLGGQYSLKIELKNGKNITIGTQNKEGIERVLSTYSSKFDRHEK